TPGGQTPSGPRWPNACRCLADLSLRAAQCGFFLPDVFLTWRGPLGPLAGTRTPVRWTIHPWTDVEGAFEMGMEVHAGEEWLPEETLGQPSQVLARDQLASQDFMLKLPIQDATPLRTTLTFRRRGDKQPFQATVEILLPERERRPKD